MSTKTGAHLYEILRSATNGGSNALRAPGPQPIIRPAAPPPSDEPVSSTGTSTLTPPPLPMPPNVEAIVRPPDTAKEPTPLPRLRVEPTRPRIMLTPNLPGSTVHPAPQPRLAEPPRPLSPATPGERVLKLTYNNAAFAALIAVAVLFGAYSAGIRVGRGQSTTPPAAAQPPVTEPDPLASANPPPPAQLYSIKLMEWSARNQQELTIAKNNAQSAKNSLEKAGWRDAQFVPTSDRVVLLYGTFENRNSEQAKATLEALKKVKLDRDREPRFAKAGFIPVTK